MPQTRYAEQADLTVPIEAFDGTAVAGLVDQYLDNASSEADGYLTSRFRLPLTEWGADLRQAVAAIATYRLMMKRGFQPGAEDAEQLRLASKDAMAWLDKVVAGKVTPQGVKDASAGQNDTDATGEQRDAPVVVQAYPAECRPASFDCPDDDFCADGGVGPPISRGW